jgi:antitoxin component of RelBE/YafQ-DinJ toxin-antitoxin module
MKKTFTSTILIILLFTTKQISACYIPCDSYAQEKSQEAQKEITTSYNELDNKIKDSEDAYKKYYNSIKKQNELLEKIIKTKKYTITQMKKVNFLLNKIIQNKNITIDIEILNAIKKLNNNNTIQKGK